MDRMDTHSRLAPQGDADEVKLWGLLGEFETPADLKRACKKVRDAGFTKWDALTPFPVHGIEEAMGIRWTILPWLVLGGGLTGMATAILLQWWTNAVDYPFLISGKPMWSLPANVPVIFELTVLLSAFAAFFGMLILNLLPELWHPLFGAKKQPRLTSDRFAIVIEAADPLFKRQQVELLLSGAGASGLEAALAPARREPLPMAIHAVGMIVTALALIPPAYAAKSWVVKSKEPRIHVVPDMDWQAKSKAQQPNPLFERLFGDPRASLLAPAGTVARGELWEDEHLYAGKDGEAWASGFPFDVTPEVVERGRSRYAITCQACHGALGRGDGLVSLRAARLSPTTGTVWVPPIDMHDPRIVAMPEGEIFNTITHGIRNMGAYGEKLSPEDRWAVIAYVRALQASRQATLDEIPLPERERLAAERDAGR